MDPKIGWLCSTAWTYEIGNTDVTLWPSEAALRHNCSCIGIQTKNSSGKIIHECTPVQIMLQQIDVSIPAALQAGIACARAGHIVDGPQFTELADEDE